MALLSYPTFWVKTFHFKMHSWEAERSYGQSLWAFLLPVWLG